MPLSPTSSPRADMRWRRALLCLYLATPVFVAIKQWVGHVDYNFVIFRYSYQHLVTGRDLYVTPDQLDFFKYSPTFAFLFAPFAVLPVIPSLALWSFLNVASFYYAVRRLLPDARGTLVLALVWLEVFGTTQRAQSNALVTALILLAFVALERGDDIRAGAHLALGTLIKLFPLAALSLAIPQRRTWRTVAATVLGLAVMIALPLFVLSPSELAAQYRSWWALELADANSMGHGGGSGLYGGVMHQFRLWFGVTWPNWPVQLVGTGLLLLPLALRRDRWADWSFRVCYLCSLLVYLVIFNHQSESPTFVIAMTGIAIWFVISPRSRLTLGLLCLAILLVSFGTSDIMPRWVRTHIMVPWRVKTIPCALAWVVMQLELLGVRRADLGERAQPDVASLQASTNAG